MANVPEPRGLRVSPSRSPLPGQRIDTPALAFGAGTAQGLGNLGQAVSEAADTLHRHVEQFQAINNKVAADQRALDYDVDSNNIMREFQETNPGMAAYENRQQLFDRLGERRAAGGEGLSPDAQLMYNSASRAQHGRMVAAYSTWAAAQRNTAIDATYTATLDNERAKAAADPDYTDTARNRIYAEIGIHSGVKGWSQEQTTAVLRKEVGQMYQDQIGVAVNTGDYPKAEALFEAHSTDMTDDQIRAVSSAMKVGRNAFEANLKADAFMEGRVPVTGADGKGNPLDLLKSAAPGAVITSNKRSAKHNAEVGGVPNSDHLTGEAADFRPAKGETMAQLAARLRSAHVGEVVVESDHVHVEWGKGAGSKQWTGQATGVMDPHAYEARATEAAMEYVKEQFPNNPVLQQQTLAAIRQRINVRSGIMQDDQQSAYSRLLGAITAGGVQSEPGLATAYPGATSDLASLPGNYQVAIRNQLKGNANAMTPERQLRLQTINGMRAAATDLTSPWFRANLADYDLPPGVTTQLMKDQAKDKAAIQKKAAGVQQDNVVQKALNSVSGKAAINSLGIRYQPSADPETNRGYFQFAGALKAYTENYQAAHGKLPDQKAMDLIISQVTAEVGKTPGWKVPLVGWEIGGKAGVPAFTVPDADRQAILDLAAANGMNLTEDQISAAYQRRRNRAR